MSILAMIMISEASLNTLIVAVSAVLTSIAGSITAIVVSRRGNARVEEKVVTLATSLVDEDGKQKIDKVQERVATLATNIDGAMTEIKETIAAKNLAEGKLEGIAGEQARTAVEPQSDTAQKQMDAIQATVNEGAATSLRNEAAAIGVADALAAQQKRADEHKGDEPGAAADAALKSCTEEK